MNIRKFHYGMYSGRDEGFWRYRNARKRAAMRRRGKKAFRRRMDRQG